MNRFATRSRSFSLRVVSWIMLKKVFSIIMSTSSRNQSQRNMYLWFLKFLRATGTPSAVSGCARPQQAGCSSSRSAIRRNGAASLRWMSLTTSRSLISSSRMFWRRQSIKERLSSPVQLRNSGSRFSLISLRSRLQLFLMRRKRVSFSKGVVDWPIFSFSRSSSFLPQQMLHSISPSKMLGVLAAQRLSLSSIQHSASTSPQLGSIWKRSPQASPFLLLREEELELKSKKKPEVLLRLQRMIMRCVNWPGSSTPKSISSIEKNTFDPISLTRERCPGISLSRARWGLAERVFPMRWQPCPSTVRFTSCACFTKSNTLILSSKLQSLLSRGRKRQYRYCFQPGGSEPDAFLMLNTLRSFQLGSPAIFTSKLTFPEPTFWISMGNLMGTSSPMGAGVSSQWFFLTTTSPSLVPRVIPVRLITSGFPFVIWNTTLSRCFSLLDSLRFLSALSSLLMFAGVQMSSMSRMAPMSRLSDRGRIWKMFFARIAFSQASSSLGSPGSAQVSSSILLSEGNLKVQSSGVPPQFCTVTIILRAFMFFAGTQPQFQLKHRNLLCSSCASWNGRVSILRYFCSCQLRGSLSSLLILLIWKFSQSAATETLSFRMSTILRVGQEPVALTLMPHLNIPRAENPGRFFLPLGFFSFEFTNNSMSQLQTSKGVKMMPTRISDFAAIRPSVKSREKAFWMLFCEVVPFFETSCSSTQKLASLKFFNFTVFLSCSLTLTTLKFTPSGQSARQPSPPAPIISMLYSLRRLSFGFSARLPGFQQPASSWSFYITSSTSRGSLSLYFFLWQGANETSMYVVSRGCSTLQRGSVWIQSLYLSGIVVSQLICNLEALRMAILCLESTPRQLGGKNNRPQFSSQSEGSEQSPDRLSLCWPCEKLSWTTSVLLWRPGCWGQNSRWMRAKRLLSMSPLAGQERKTPAASGRMLKQEWVSDLLTSRMDWQRLWPGEQGTKETRLEGRVSTMGMKAMVVSRKEWPTRWMLPAKGGIIYAAATSFWTLRLRVWVSLMLRVTLISALSLCCFRQNYSIISLLSLELQRIAKNCRCWKQQFPLCRGRKVTVNLASELAFTEAVQGYTWNTVICSPLRPSRRWLIQNSCSLQARLFRTVISWPGLRVIGSQYPKFSTSSDRESSLSRERTSWKHSLQRATYFSIWSTASFTADYSRSSDSACWNLSSREFSMQRRSISLILPSATLLRKESTWHCITGMGLMSRSKQVPSRSTQSKDMPWCTCRKTRSQQLMVLRGVNSTVMRLQDLPGTVPLGSEKLNTLLTSALN